MTRALRAVAALALAALLLAGCGELPRPFEGRPGKLGATLAQPPPARLAVPAPTGALLPETAAKPYAEAITKALVAREVPAVEGPAHPGDWRLTLSADRHGATVTPRFTVSDPQGKAAGETEGPPVAAAAWTGADPAMLHDEAAAAGPAIADLLAGIDAARRRSDPNSLYNRPPRVRLARVTGAPGDGNISLALEMRRLLPQQGEVLVSGNTPPPDFTVAGSVRATPGPGDETRVEIQWHVTDAAGHDLGKVVQLNDVPKGTLNGIWGDIALVVAQQAAGGVAAIIDKQTGRIPAAAAAVTKP